MKKYKTISTSNLPMRMPIDKTLLGLIIWDNYITHDIVGGIFLTLIALFWVLYVYAKYKQEPVDVIGDENE